MNTCTMKICQIIVFWLVLTVNINVNRANEIKTQVNFTSPINNFNGSNLTDYYNNINADKTYKSSSAVISSMGNIESTSEKPLMVQTPIIYKSFSTELDTITIEPNTNIPADISSELYNKSLTKPNIELNSNSLSAHPIQIRVSVDQKLLNTTKSTEKEAEIYKESFTKNVHTEFYNESITESLTTNSDKHIVNTSSSIDAPDPKTFAFIDLRNTTQRQLLLPTSTPSMTMVNESSTEIESVTNHTTTITIETSSKTSEPNRKWSKSSDKESEPIKFLANYKLSILLGSTGFIYIVVLLIAYIMMCLTLSITLLCITLKDNNRRILRDSENYDDYEMQRLSANVHNYSII